MQPRFSIYYIYFCIPVCSNALLLSHSSKASKPFLVTAAFLCMMCLRIVSTFWKYENILFLLLHIRITWLFRWCCTLYVKLVIFTNCLTSVPIKSLRVKMRLLNKLSTTDSVKRGWVFVDKRDIFIIFHVLFGRCGSLYFSGCHAQYKCTHASSVRYTSSRLLLGVCSTWKAKRLSPCLERAPCPWCDRVKCWKYPIYFVTDRYVGYPIILRSSIYMNVIFLTADELISRLNFVITWW